MTDEANGAYNDASQQVTSLTQQLREAKATTERYLRDFEALSRFELKHCIRSTQSFCARSTWSLWNNFFAHFHHNLPFFFVSRAFFLFLFLSTFDHQTFFFSRTAKVTDEYAESVKKVQALHVAANMAEKEDKLKREEIGRLMTDKNTVRIHERVIFLGETLSIMLAVWLKSSIERMLAFYVPFLSRTSFFTTAYFRLPQCLSPHSLLLLILLRHSFSQIERKLAREHTEKLAVEQRLNDTKAPMVQLLQEKNQLEKELDGYRKAELALNQRVEAVGRQKALQEQQTARALELAKDNSDQAKEQERIAYSMEAEVQALKSEAKEQRAMIHQVEKEREKYGVDAAAQRGLYLEAMEEVKLRDLRINELLKDVAEWEKKMKTQAHLYEQVRGERNTAAKALAEAQDTIAEMNRKFKIMTHQTEQLKEEISAKDTALVKESFEHQKVGKRNEQQEQKISRAEKLLKANEDVIHKQDSEIQRLASMVKSLAK